MGGWAVYKYHRKQGKSHEFAIREFERITAKTQQSADIDQLSDFQKGNALARTFTMFLSAPNAYYRAELRAIRQFKRGEISNKEFGKKIAIYHFLIPSLFQFVANGFRFDEEDQLIAAISGSLNGFLILGEVITNAVRVAMGERAFQKDLQFMQAFQELSLIHI